jgi:PBP1b-binding outer membrane lipoprotein LpoB
MKKIVRILGITLSVLVLASCSNDDEVNNALPEVTPSSLEGSYKVSIAVVDNAVDTNNDGFSSQNLLLEGYNSCGYDDIIEISKTSFSVIKKGVSCNDNEKNEIFEFKLDEATKTLDLYVNDKIVESIKKVYLQIGENKTELKYERFDSVLNQMVYFKLTKI